MKAIWKVITAEYGVLDSAGREALQESCPCSKPDFDRLRSSCWTLTVVYSAQDIRQPS